MASFLNQKFREQARKHKDPRIGLEASGDVKYSTGFLNIDFRNGNTVKVTKSDGSSFSYINAGITDGSFVLLIGRSGCGKTTFAYQSAANIIRPFEHGSIYDDSVEAGIEMARKSVLTKFYGQELIDRCVSRNSGVTAENFFERFRMVHDLKLENRELLEYNTGMLDVIGRPIYKMQPTCFILDSIALLEPEKYTDEDTLSGQMAATAAAKTNTRIFKKIIPMAKAVNIILFGINHITESITMGAPKANQLAFLKQGEALPGGRAVAYLANLLIRFDDNTKLTEDALYGIDGIQVDLSFVKSRSNKTVKQKAGTLILDYDKGFDADLSALHFLIENKCVEGTTYMTLPGSTTKFTRKTFKEKLQDANFYAEFKKTYMDALLNLPGRFIDAETSISDTMSADVLAMINDAIHDDAA